MVVVLTLDPDARPAGSGLELVGRAEQVVSLCNHSRPSSEAVAESSGSRPL